MSQVYYLLLGIGGIQKFIFGSNRLRIALNASQAVSGIFQDLNSHRTQKMEIGYEGGGNALLLFEEESGVKEFLQGFSKYVLTDFPGLQLQYAVEKASKDISGEEFQELLFVLNQKQASQKVFKGITSPLQFGFGQDCHYGGGAATTLSEITRKSGLKPVSEITSKFLHNEPQQYHCPSGWNLPKDMEDLGQTQHDDNWIAVVHADGNGLGQMISKTQSLQELRELSKKFSSTVVEAYSNMQKRLVDESPIWFKELNLAESMLPLRHIIL
ncbi:MAG: hypothetical protein H3C47_06315, partial [Candidatus Cloacimonetes bacterium]|nr:hypothetical protein [Candidatus Cloacimonadota bacterium]